ncbi:hypothetical protein D3C71_2169290 [compost metagenome]
MNLSIFGRFEVDGHRLVHGFGIFAVPQTVKKNLIDWRAFRVFIRHPHRLLGDAVI